MVQPLPTKEKDKLYPEILYYASRVSQCGHQPVFKRLMPDGEPTELSISPSPKICDHSFEFNYGYSGSGPAQLSFALLLDATTDPDTALNYYQDFKWAFVSGWGDDWSITRSEIRIWLAEQRKKELEAMINRN